jgi:hypothetical protein
MSVKCGTLCQRLSQITSLNESDFTVIYRSYLSIDYSCWEASVQVHDGSRSVPTRDRLFTVIMHSTDWLLNYKLVMIP